MAALSCSQCGRSAPADPAELSRWKHGELVVSDELDETTATMLLCPECDEEDRSGEYEAGEPG
jgi:hypothetical protein